MATDEWLASGVSLGRAVLNENVQKHYQEIQNKFFILTYMVMSKGKTDIER